MDFFEFWAKIGNLLIFEYYPASDAFHRTGLMMEEQQQQSDH
jgi:hypothetical protein